MESGSELPSEITCFEILPRLPAKSLMRFKCVCKSWSSLTSNSSFVNAYQSFNSNTPTHLLLTSWDKSTRQQHFSVQINQEGNPTAPTHLLNLPTLHHERLYKAQSVHGLVFLYLPNEHCDYPNRIFNPCTREYIILPHSPPMYHRGHVTHHFGFSPLTNEYKVLQGQWFEPQDSTASGVSYIFNIFKLGTFKLAVDLNDVPFDPFKCHLFRRKHVCVNGAIHWMHGTQNRIVVFDIGDEKFRAIPNPKDYSCVMLRVLYPFGNIVEVGGCLALIEDRQLVKQNMMGLWILKDYQNQMWVKETITFPFLWRELGYPVPFCAVHSGEELLIALQSSVLMSGQNPCHVRVHMFNMKSFWGSEIVLPTEWTFLSDNRVKLLAGDDDNIAPLR